MAGSGRVGRCQDPCGGGVGRGSWKARRFLGQPGIEEGAPADLVALERDPREDLTVLATPSLIVMDGRVVRGVAASATA